MYQNYTNRVKNFILDMINPDTQVTINDNKNYNKEKLDKRFNNETFVQKTPFIFKGYANEKERIFGILIKKDSNDFIIGSTDLCGCSIDASFKEIEKSDLDFYKKIEEIIDTLVIY